jgi:hypothetical protein
MSARQVQSRVSTSGDSNQRATHLDFLSAIFTSMRIRVALMNLTQLAGAEELEPIGLKLF